MNHEAWHKTLRDVDWISFGFCIFMSGCGISMIFDSCQGRGVDDHGCRTRINVVSPPVSSGSQ